MDALPPELVIYILESLDQADLRSAAAVSRLFYASAWSARLHIRRKIVWRNAASHSSLPEIVQHARKKGLRLSFWIDLRGVGQGDTLHHAHSSSTAQKILSLVEVALPILVHLTVFIAGTLLPTLTVVLRNPAPHIEFFHLLVDQLDYSAPFYQVPVDLFMESAPKLRRLELTEAALGREPVAALARVHSVTVAYTENFPYIDYARHFARLRSLGLRNWGTREDAPPRPLLDLSGLRLRKLLVEDYAPYALMPTIMRSTDIAAIASVTRICREVHWDDPLWTRPDDAPLSVRLTRHVPQDADIIVLVVPAHRRWQREYNFHWNLTEEFPILELPGRCVRLSYLRIENRLITSLLECAGLALPALRELRIDFEHLPGYSEDTYAELVWPPDWPHQRGIFSFNDDNDRSGPVFASPSYSHVGCSALQQLTLVSLDTTEITLASEEIAFLGRALSQCSRPAQDRAALVLAGITLKTPIAQTLLDQTFSCIQRRAHADWASQGKRDADFWDDPF